MRNDDRIIKINSDPLYQDLFFDRVVGYISQFGTPSLRYPTPAEIRRLDLVGHVWTLGDRYYKLAHRFYGQPKLWWVIAWFNKAPTESHLVVGDVIQIPTPLETVLQYYST